MKTKQLLILTVIVFSVLGLLSIAQASSVSPTGDVRSAEIMPALPQPFKPVDADLATLTYEPPYPPPATYNPNDPANVQAWADWAKKMLSTGSDADKKYVAQKFYELCKDNWGGAGHMVVAQVFAKLKNEIGTQGLINLFKAIFELANTNGDLRPAGYILGQLITHGGEAGKALAIEIFNALAQDDKVALLNTYVTLAMTPEGPGLPRPANMRGINIATVLLKGIGNIHQQTDILKALDRTVAAVILTNLPHSNPTDLGYQLIYHLVSNDSVGAKWDHPNIQVAAEIFAAMMKLGTLTLQNDWNDARTTTLNLAACAKETFKLLVSQHVPNAAKVLLNLYVKVENGNGNALTPYVTALFKEIANWDTGMASAMLTQLRFFGTEGRQLARLLQPLIGR